MRKLIMIVAAVAVAASGCGGCGTDGTGTGQNDDPNVATNADLDAGPNANIGIDGGADVADNDAVNPNAESCPLVQQCGNDCCDADEDCINDVCFAPCAGERCGAAQELCCEGEDVCLGTQCIVPGTPCVTTDDCADDEICEPTLGACIPRDAVEVCEFIPPVGQFTPEVDCRWTPNAGDLDAVRDDVVATPVVGNLTDDNGDGLTNTDDLPDIAFLTYDLGQSCCNVAATLRIVSGGCNADGTMTTLASINALGMDNSAGIALGDLDNDGVPELTAIGMFNANGRPQGVIAWKRMADDGSAWEEFWRNEDYPAWNVHTRGGATISIGDVDANGAPEVIVGNVVLNGQDGTLMWDGLDTVGNTAGIGNNGFLGPSSAVGDIDLDGMLEIAAGNTLYDHDGTELWTYPFTSMNSGCGGQLPCDGFTAMANFDADPEGEVVIIRLGEVFIIEHTGELLWQWAIPTDDCANNESGPPTVADFDGDGRPEIGTAAADFYTVLDMDCDADPVPAGCASRGVLWATPNQDCSSRVTASSVFDFEGDGKAEMVYADETTFRIFDGTNGNILYEDPTHGSHTRIEMPVVVDVDNDGNSEVIIPENGSMSGNPGIDVWADADDNWVRTRRIWNQHAYHVTNVEEDGSIPQVSMPNWSNSRLNNFRQNVQPKGAFDAPNLVVESVTARGIGCGDTFEVVIRVTVTNSGALGVSPGVPVRIYARSGMDTTVISDAVTMDRLLPGGRETIEIIWTVPADYVMNGFEIGGIIDPDETTNECIEDDNEITINGDDIVFSAPDLVIKEISATGEQTCGQTSMLGVIVTVRNDGTQPVPADVPVVVDAAFAATTAMVGTVRTSAELQPGQEETFNLSWDVPAGAIGQNVTLTATVDPDGEVYACDDKSTGEVVAQCRVPM